MYGGGMTKAVAAQTSHIPPLYIGFVANRGSVLSCVLSKSAPSATFQPSRWSTRSKSTWWQACATGASRHTLLKEKKAPQIIDGRYIGQHHDGPNAWSRHCQLNPAIGLHQLAHQFLQAVQFVQQRLMHGKKSLDASQRAV